jgi:DICT domain-containing protein
LAGEWTVVVVGSHYAGALIAKDLGDTGPERDRRFEFLVSHDRTLVLDAARSLLSRLVPLN